MKHKRVIAVIATVALLSVASVGSVFAENETTINSKGKILTSSDEVLFDASDFTTLSNCLDEVFQSVSDGKALIASAITDKGVTTAADATFQTMADNINDLADSKYSAGYDEGAASVTPKTVNWSCSYRDGSNDNSTKVGVWSSNIGKNLKHVYVCCTNMSTSGNTKGSGSGSITSTYDSSSGVVTVRYNSGTGWMYVDCSASGYVVYM